MTQVPDPRASFLKKGYGVKSLGTRSNRNALYKLTHDARKRLKRGLEMAGFTAEDIRAAFAG